MARTTLADIAQQTQVPLGMVYYHFRTKEALVEAAVQAQFEKCWTGLYHVMWVSEV